MAQRLPREFAALLATVFLLLVVERGNAQQPQLPPIPSGPPAFSTPPKPAEQKRLTRLEQLRLDREQEGKK